MENIYMTMILSSRLKDILLKINDNISRFILNLEYNQDYEFQFSFLDITDDESTISFLQSNKYQEIPQIKGNGDAVWTCSSRNEIRIGRLLNKIAPFYQNYEIEKWVNLFKAEFKNSLKNIKFKIIEGENIARYYNGKRYSSGNGPLNKSCMRYDHCAEFMQLYTKNPDKIKMLILYENKEQISGRAILWKLDYPHNMWLLDRIYVKEDSDVILFKKYADKQGWLYKNQQTFDAVNVVKNGEEKYINMKVYIKGDFKLFPYIDTLLFYNTKDKYLTNDEKEYESIPHIIKLRETNGGDSGNENFVFDVLNGEFINIEDSCFCFYGDGYTYKNNAFFIKEFDEYSYPTELRYSIYNKRFITKQSSTFSKTLGSFILESDAYKVYIDRERTQFDYMLKNDFDKIYGYVNGNFYIMDILVKGADDAYYFKDDYDEAKIMELRQADVKALDDLMKSSSYIRKMMGIDDKKKKIFSDR